MMNMHYFMTKPAQDVVFMNLAALPTEIRKRRKSKVCSQPAEIWKIKRTRHALLLDWNEMKNSSRQSMRAGFEQAIELCEATRKVEIVFEDIAPNYRIEDRDPKVVIAAQERIVSIFMQAATTWLRELPEHRLSLRGGTFDLRFYLRRNRPSDYLRPFEDS